MKKLLLILIFILTTSYQETEKTIITIVKETPTELILNGYKNKSDNHIFHKVGEVHVLTPEYHNFGGRRYESVRYIFVWKGSLALTFVEWCDRSENTILTNYVID